MQAKPHGRMLSPSYGETAGAGGRRRVPGGLFVPGTRSGAGSAKKSRTGQAGSELRACFGLHS